MNHEQLQELIEDPMAEFFYIMKGGYYYGPKSQGYVSDILLSGVYGKEEAIKHARGCSDLYLVPIDITKHNKMIADEIDGLSKRFIGHSFGEELKNKWSNDDHLMTDIFEKEALSGMEVFDLNSFKNRFKTLFKVILKSMETYKKLK